MFESGKLVEQELLGSIKREQQTTFNRLHEVETEYMGYQPSLEYVKNHQRGDPYNPKRFFPRSIMEELRASPELSIEDENQLGYYTAVGSAFDLYHGIDAFFEYKAHSGQVVRITIDVTTNPNKDRYKADVVLAIPSGGLDTSDANYRELIAQYAQQIEAEILTNIN